MGIWPDDVRVNEGGAAALAAIRYGLPHHLIACERVAAVNLLYIQSGKAGDQFRNAATRGLDFDRHRYGVPVVFNQIQNRQLEITSSVQRLKKLTLAGSTLARRDIDNAVRVIAGDQALRVTDQLGPVSCFGASDRLQKLSAGRGRLRRYIEPRTAPMARHLAAS